MNKQMWESPATQRNVTQLLKDGVRILGPDSGVQACGETGLGRMLEPEALFAELLSNLNAELSARPLAGKRVLITAGPTVEKIDPVRAITNLSSGKMGYSIAEAAIEMGAEVTLISGPTHLTPPSLASVIAVESGAEMFNAVMANISPQDIFISVAAVADYRVASPSAEKIKKSRAALNIQLVPNEDILAAVAALPNAPFCVGFAAESENLLAYAEEKRKRKNIPLIVANLISEALGTDESTLTLLDSQGAHPLPKSSKAKSAWTLLNHIAKML
jgi:phosphopantothenoylcysteine decarboxylase/phosphopantothenate--cysteine ligase